MSRKLQLFYDVKLRIQSPPFLDDSSAIFNRILTSGADGMLQLKMDKTIQWGSFRWYFGPWFGINWLKSQVPGDSLSPGFSFLSGGGNLGVQLGPTVISYQLEYHDITGDTSGFLASKLKRTISTNLLIALDTDLYQLQFQYLVNSAQFTHSSWEFWRRKSQRLSDNQNLAIQAGFSFHPFK